MYVYAGLRLRAAAFGLDYIIIVAYIIVLATLSALLLQGPFQRQVLSLFANPISTDAIAFSTLILPVILYFTFGESSSWQATWGKRKLGLRVICTNSDRLSFSRALSRSVAKFLPWQLAHTCLFHIKGWPIAPENPSPIVLAGLTLVWIIVGAYVLSMVASKTDRTLYDRLAGTFVIVVPCHDES